MQHQLKLLEQLQSHDARLQEYESSLRSLPEKLQAMRNDLAKMEALLEKERLALAETDKWRNEREQQLRADEAAIAKAKAKLQQVKTGRDFGAAQRETEATRKVVTEREEELLKIIEALESSRKSIQAHEADVAQLREHVANEETATNAKLAELRSKVAGEREARDKLAAAVKPDVLKRYGSIRIRRGLAVVPVSAGVCKGCHMAIPPQLYNVLQRASSLETCPSCHRIIYWDEIMKEDTQAPGPASGGPPEPTTA